MYDKKFEISQAFRQITNGENITREDLSKYLPDLD